MADGRRPTVRILDGGLSTQLENHHGVDLSEHPKLWTAGLLTDATGRTKLRAAHDAYLDAGASIILSSSYQTSPSMDDATLAASVRLALDARDAYHRPGVEAWVSLGPYGSILADGSEYRGDYLLNEFELKEWHATRLEKLLLAAAEESRRPADGIAFETVPSFVEVQGILSLLCEPQYCGTPAWVSFSCRDGSHLADGTPLIDVAAACRDAFSRRSPSARSYMGANCVPPAIVDSILDAVLPAAEGRPRPRRVCCDRRLHPTTPPSPPRRVPPAPEAAAHRT